MIRKKKTLTRFWVRQNEILEINKLCTRLFPAQNSFKQDCIEFGCDSMHI